MILKSSFPIQISVTDIDSTPTYWADVPISISLVIVNWNKAKTANPGSIYIV